MVNNYSQSLKKSMTYTPRADTFPRTSSVGNLIVIEKNIFIVPLVKVVLYTKDFFGMFLPLRYVPLQKKLPMSTYRRHFKAHFWHVTPITCVAHSKTSCYQIPWIEPNHHDKLCLEFFFAKPVKLENLF